MMDVTASVERDGDLVVLRLEGEFDRASAWALRQRIDREPAAELVLDFSLVSNCSDLALAVLAHGVLSATRRVVFRGLREHQRRIFQYCGVAVEDAGERRRVEPALNPQASSGAP